MVIDIPMTGWTPDLADLNSGGLTVARNCYPGIGNGQGAVTYAPLHSAALWANASLSNTPKGAATGLDSLSLPHTFVGTRDKISKFDSVSRNWKDVSRPSLPYQTSQSEVWKYCQYGSGLIATNFSDNPQIANMDTDAKFEDLTTLVRGRHIAQHRGFVILANCYDSFDGHVPNRIRWSAFENPYDWAFSAATMADFQDQQDVGPINGIVVDEDVWLLCRDAIVRMTFIGAPIVYQFITAISGKGCSFPQSVITTEGVTYYLDDDGFYSFQKGQVQPIGLGKINQTFFELFDSSNAFSMTAVADPRRSLIYWTFASKGAPNGVPDTMLIYNLRTGNWSIADATAPFIFSALSLAYTLEDLVVYGDIANIPAPFDSPIWAGGNAILWCLDNSGKVFTQTGPNMQATIETCEYQLVTPSPGERGSPPNRSDRATILKVRPIFESGGQASVSIACRELSYTPVQWQNPSNCNVVDGYANIRRQSRYQRFRIVLSGNWDKFTKIQVDAVPAGAR